MKMVKSITALQQSYETGYQASITFYSSLYLLRASLDTSGKVISDVIAQLDSAQVMKNTSVVDAFVFDSFIIIKFDNNTFQAYLKPEKVGGKLTPANRGNLKFSQDSDFPLSYYIDNFDKSKPILFTVDNNNDGQNYLQKYEILTTNNPSTQVADVYFNRVRLYSLQSVIVSSMAATRDYLIVGCSFCNTYQGQIQVFNKTTMKKLLDISGSSDNQMLGSDVKVVDKGIKDYFQIYASSNSGRLTLNRQYYVNVIDVLINSNAGNPLSYQLSKQFVRDLVQTPQGNIRLDVFSQEILMVKYDYYKQLFSVRSCDYRSFYNKALNTCQRCSTSEGFSFNPQSKACSNCTDLWIANYYQPSNGYYQSLYKQICSQFDSKAVADYVKMVNQQQKSNATSKQSNSASSNNTASEDIDPAIIIGISISFPTLTLTISIICVVYYLKYKTNKKKREEEERMQKQQKQKENEKALKQKQFDFLKEDELRKVESEISQIYKKSTDDNISRNISCVTSTMFETRRLDEIQLDIENLSVRSLEREVQKEVKNIKRGFEILEKELKQTENRDEIVDSATTHRTNSQFQSHRNLLHHGNFYSNDTEQEQGVIQNASFGPHTNSNEEEENDDEQADIENESQYESKNFEDQ